MKIENVYIKPDGQICACTVPVPPEPKRDRRHGQTTEFHFKIEYNKYRDALKACKDSSVRFEDQFSATILLHASLKIEPPRKAVNEELKEHVKNDTFYPLQCSIQIVEQRIFDTLYGSDHAEYETRKVARLIPEATSEIDDLSETGKRIVSEIKAKYSRERKTAPIVEESQRHLWDSLYDKHMVHNGFYPGAVQDHILSDLKENYIITRKP